MQDYTESCFIDQATGEIFPKTEFYLKKKFKQGKEIEYILEDRKKLFNAEEKYSFHLYSKYIRLNVLDIRNKYPELNLEDLGMLVLLSEYMRI